MTLPTNIHCYFALQVEKELNQLYRDNRTKVFKTLGAAFLTSVLHAVKNGLEPIDGTETKNADGSLVGDVLMNNLYKISYAEELLDAAILSVSPDGMKEKILLEENHDLYKKLAQGYANAGIKDIAESFQLDDPLLNIESYINQINS